MLCDVTDAGLLTFWLTDAGSVPKCTTESAGSLVVQVIVAVDVPIADAERAEIVGGVMSGP